MKLTLLSLVTAVFGAMPILASISLGESQLIWPESFPFVTGYLLLCNGAPVNFFTGPCGNGKPSDVIIFDNAKHEVFFLSNLADGGGEPADVPFTGTLNNVINPRFVLEPTPVNGLSTYLWVPGPNDPGFYGSGKTWTIESNAQVAPEPSTSFLTVIALALAFSVRLFRRRSAR